MLSPSAGVMLKLAPLSLAVADTVRVTEPVMAAV